MGGPTRDKRKTYFTILSDGTLRQGVTKETPGAEFREYETSDGKKGEKWEIVYDQMEGHITDIQFKDGDYGIMINLTFSWDGGEAVVTANTTTPFGEDIMKRLPPLDFTKEVRLRPFSFTDENKKLRKGVSLTQQRHGQDWEKINNFFYNTKEKIALNGYPTPENNGNGFDKDDWKVFYITARKFLIKFTEESVIPKLASNKAKIVSQVELKEEAEDFNPDDIPF